MELMPLRFSSPSSYMSSAALTASGVLVKGKPSITSFPSKRWQSLAGKEDVDGYSLIRLSALKNGNDRYLEDRVGG